jgi:hypothetical protein
MADRNSFRVLQALFALLVLLLLAGHAQAYVVPGLGPEFLGQFFALAMWMFVAFSSLMLWPAYAFFRYFRRILARPRKNAATEGANSASSGALHG